VSRRALGAASDDATPLRSNYRNRKYRMIRTGIGMPSSHNSAYFILFSSLEITVLKVVFAASY
jgi:acid phosphatase family membrane protein YuiD